MIILNGKERHIQPFTQWPAAQVWEEFGAEVPMSDDEVEFEASVKEDRKPVMKGGVGKFTINKDDLRLSGKLKANGERKVPRHTKVSKTVIENGGDR